MAHLIESRDNQFGLVMAWHKLTKIVEKLTPEICFPWEIVFCDDGYTLPDGTFKKKGAWKTIVANDDFLPLGNGQSVNLDTYTVRCPRDLWNLRDEITAGAGNEVVSAGTVANRARFFISTKLTELEKLTINDGSTVELLLNSMGSMDKSLHEQHSISSTRIVCNNTLMMSFLGDEVKFRYRHSKNMKTRIDNDKPLIEKVAGFSAVVKATFDKLLTNPCTVDRARHVYTGLISSAKPGEEISTRAENMIDEHVTCFRQGLGNVGKTEFDLLNGWTEPKTRGYEGTEKSAWNRFESSEFGVYATQKQELANLLTNNRPKLAEIELAGKRLVEGATALVMVN